MFERPAVSFRIINNDDEDFLRRLYASTREWEFELMAWSDADKADFLRQQFDAQSSHIALNYIGSTHRIIQLNNIDIGRLIINRTDDCLHIVDISLLTEYRGHGIGTDLLRTLLNEAHGGKVPVRLAAQRMARAFNMYLRHGFKILQDEGAVCVLERQPDLRPREI